MHRISIVYIADIPPSHTSISIHVRRHNNTQYIHFQCHQTEHIYDAVLKDNHLIVTLGTLSHKQGIIFFAIYLCKFVIWPEVSTPDSARYGCVVLV